MATYQKFQQFVEDLAEQVHDLGADTLKVCLSLSAPLVTESILSDISQIASGDGYTTDGETPSITSSAQTTGTYKLVLADVVWTATTGSFGNFRYATLFNDTPTSPLNPLIGFWDYGSTVDLGAGETFTWDADPSNGILTIV